MNLPDNIEAIRTRLASRTSFFGGALSTRDNIAVRSWKDIPSVKAAASGRSAAHRTAPPRLKLTTAAAEAKNPTRNTSKNTAKTNKEGKKETRSASKSNRTATAAATTAAVSALIQRTPLEAPQHSAPINKSKPIALPLPDAKKTMLRHQQMTSLGVQTVQLLKIPKEHPDAMTNGTIVVEEQQNKVPENAEKNHQNSEEEAATKPLTSPRRQHAASITTATAEALAPKPKIKQRLKGTFYGSAQPPAARHRIRTVDDESHSDLDSFIETDEEEEEESDGDSGDEVENENAGVPGHACGPTAGKRININDSSDTEQHQGDLYLSKRLNNKRNKPKKWKTALKEALNGYDASKFAAVDAQPDRRMHATYEDILAEEARAAKIAREIDRIEAEKEIEARALEKEERMKKRRRQQEQLVLDDSSDSDGSDNDDEDNGGVLSDSSSSDEDEGEDGDVEKHVRKRRKNLAGFLASF